MNEDALFDPAREFAAAHLQQLCAEMLDTIDDGQVHEMTRRMLTLLPDLPRFPAEKVAGQIVRMEAVRFAARGANR